jgi:hypothetical protein
VRRAFLGAALLLTTLATPARAELPFGTIASVDRVEVLDDRVRIVGAFVTLEQQHYGDGRRGYVELTCAADKLVECRAQWQTIASSVELHACVAFGWDAAPARVYGPGTAPAHTEHWAVVRGVRVLNGDDPQCVRARAAPPAYAPAKPVVIVAPAVQPLPTERDWYGWGILAIAYPSQVVFWLGVATERPELVTVGLVGWGLAPPIMHGSRGHVGRAFGGLAIELLTPITLASIGAALTNEGEGRATAITAGAIAGGILGSLTDALIGFDDVPVRVAIVPHPGGLALTGAF